MATLYIVLPFVVFIILTFLTGLVLKSAPSNFAHRLFAAFLAAMALWGLTIFGMRSSPNLAIAYQWEKWVFFVIPFAGIFFFHFTLRYTNTRYSSWVMRAFYGLGLLVGILSLMGLVVTGMQQKFYGYAPVLGPAFPLFLTASQVPALLGLVVLLKAHRRSHTPDERNRIAYIFLGAAIALAGGTTDFLPALGFNMYPLGILFNIVFGLLTTVAITRFRLLELRVLLRRGFAYSIVSTTVFAGYGVIFLAFSAIFRHQTAMASAVATISALLLVTILLPPIIGRVQQFVDRLFFRERYDHLLALERFTHETRDISDFTGLADSLISTVTLAMQADWVVILLPDPDTGDFVVNSATADTAVPNIRVAPDSALAKWLVRNDSVLTAQELGLDPYLQAMGDSERLTLQSSGAQLFVPMKSKRGLAGILVLGPRLVGEDYSQADIDLLTTFSSQATTIIENSLLYSQEMARLEELRRVDGLKSNLLQTVSHELKSPVTTIKTASELLLGPQENLGERNRQRLTRALRSSVERLEKLIQESLDYARMQSSQLELHVEPTNIAKLVEDTVALVQPSLKAKQQKISVSVTNDLPLLMVDSTRVERVLMNLLTNANKFTPQSGGISLRLRRDGQTLVTEISDTGPGIPEDELSHLFTQYYRGGSADRHGVAGSGLGLTIAKHLIELHGGSIDVSSSEGEGTTFSFVLPIVPAQSAEEQDG